VCYLSGQTGSKHEPCKVVLFPLARNQLSDPDLNAPLCFPIGAFDTDKRTTLSARAWDARQFQIPLTGSVATCGKVTPNEHAARIDGCFVNSNLCFVH
jgi:hypothetical protein